MQTLTLATRKSPLALRQAEMAQSWLEEKLPGTTCQILPMSTSGDERAQWELEKEGGKGLFTKELEEAILNGQADFAIHSAKDLPTEFVGGLNIAGYLPRATAHDVLVRKSKSNNPKHIATSSPRRRAQITKLYPHANWVTIRGSVATRLRKIEMGEAEATILAAAGLERLEITEHPGLTFETLPIESVVPPAGQAAIALQCRSEATANYATLLCPHTHLAVSTERAFLHHLGGGCQTPVGVHYANRTLHVFHPNSGYQNFEPNIQAIDQIEAALEPILRLM